MIGEIDVKTKTYMESIRSNSSCKNVIDKYVNVRLKDKMIFSRAIAIQIKYV